MSGQRTNSLRKCSRGGLLLEPAKNGHLFPSSRLGWRAFSSQNGANCLFYDDELHQPGVFLGFFAFFLAFRYQYFISPPREQPLVYIAIIFDTALNSSPHYV